MSKHARAISLLRHEARTSQGLADNPLLHVLDRAESRRVAQELEDAADALEGLDQ